MRQPGIRSLAISSATLALACSGPGNAAAPAPPRSIEVATMAVEETRTTGEYIGSLLSRQSVTVLPQVAGYVRKIHVEPGQRVEAGDPLIEIDARDENAALDSAAAQLNSALARRDLARRTLERTETLHKEGLAPTQEVEQRRGEHAAAEAAVRTAMAAQKQRRVALSNRTITAAIPGVVGDVEVRIGDYVVATTPLTSIASAEALELSVSISASRARRLQVGMPVEVLGEEGQVLVASSVSYVAPEADPNTQLVEVKARFDNKAGLRPRELVRARVVFAVEKALQVPAPAVQRQAGEAFAFVVVDKGGGRLAVERRLIRIGALRDRGYVVSDGLAVGDRVAVSSLHALRDDMAVVIDAKAAPGPAPSAAETAKTAPSGAASRPRQGG